MRDGERKRTYDAETTVERLLTDYPSERFTKHGNELTIPVERKFGSLETVERYVGLVLGLPVVRAAYPGAKVPCGVRARRGNRAAHYSRAEKTIALHVADQGQSWSMRETVVLHELAHHLTPDGHTAEFRACEIFLWSHVIGDEAGWLLMVAFDEAGLAIG